MVVASWIVCNYSAQSHALARHGRLEGRTALTEDCRAGAGSGACPNSEPLRVERGRNRKRAIEGPTELCAGARC